MNVDTTDLMRQDWDERARKDAFHYIASWRKDWTPESFFQSGEEDYQRLVAPGFRTAGMGTARQDACWSWAAGRGA